ncbi:hypothetical protein BDZ89DRAFT_1247190, partial [Hymenopellis radicata]
MERPTRASSVLTPSSVSRWPFLRAAAVEKGVLLYQHLALAGINVPFVLPCPAFKVINGRSRAGNKLMFQEFMLLPTSASTEAMKIGIETYHTL